MAGTDQAGGERQAFRVIPEQDSKTDPVRRRSVFRMGREQSRADWQQSLGTGSVWWVPLFPESRKEQLQRAVAASSHTWEHPDLKAQQPRALCLGPREAGGTGRCPPRPSSCPENSGSRPSLGRSRDGGVPCGNRTRGSLCMWTSTPGMGVGGTRAQGGAGGGPEEAWRGRVSRGGYELCLCQASDSPGLPSPGHWGGGAEQRWWRDPSCPQALTASALQALGWGA
nr:uncharacterized protein LOC132425117 [Delphinus delphis]